VVVVVMMLMVMMMIVEHWLSYGTDTFTALLFHVGTWGHSSITSSHAHLCPKYPPQTPCS
jgi:hypothetical protein